MTLSDDRALLSRHWRSVGLHLDTTLPDAFARGAREQPMARMIIDSATRPDSATLAEVHQRGLVVAAALADNGLVKGDAIACQVPNWLESAVIYHAALTLGLVVVPIIHIYGPAEVGYILDHMPVKAMVMPSQWRGTDYVARLESMPQRASLELVIVIGDPTAPWATPFESLEASGRQFHGDAGVHADDVCMVMFTSGTTARPKGVQHTHNTLLSEIRSWGLDTLDPATSVFLSPFPAGHMGGVLGLGRAFSSGGTSILVDAWDADRAVDLIVQHKVTSLASTPFFLRTLIDAAHARGEMLPTIAEVNMGGAGVPPALVVEADALGWGAYRTYGSTEHPTTTTSAPGDPVVWRARTDGAVAPGNEVRIVDDDGNDLPDGQPGEVVTRGPELFVGYLDPADDEGAFFDGGWYRTGDIGVLDAVGRLTIVDRKKDIIIRGGENISSQEVEAILSSHPSVAEVAVTPVDDAMFGERVCAFVVLRPGTMLDLADITAHFGSAGVARVKVPERLEIVDEFPRTALGKIRKVELRARLRDAIDSENNRQQATAITRGPHEQHR